MTRQIAILAAAVGLYLMLITPFSAYMKERPVLEKMGYIPRGEVLRFVSADQKQLMAASLVMKVLFYFGTVTDIAAGKTAAAPDYAAMSRTIHSAVRLDPYNLDGYYFAQAILAWDVGRIDVANRLLEYGMKYRDWDFYLPFFAGFNYAFFLKDYEKAAFYYKRAGELSGQELYIKLAGRYLHESGQTDLAIAYLATMEKSARSHAVKESFHTRLTALKEARRVERAVEAYRKERGTLPATVQELVASGFLKGAPVDPYGGTFFLTPDGKVRSTSKFAFAAKK